MSHNQKNDREMVARLKDSEQAHQYMVSVMEQSKNLDNKEAQELLLNALKNIAKARPEDVHIDLNNENSFKTKAVVRLLQFVSKKFM